MTLDAKAKQVPEGAILLGEDFAAEPTWKATSRDGRKIWTRACYDLVDGRWEGFVAIRFTEPQEEN